MAISAEAVAMFAQLKAEGFFNDVKSVVELGAQEMKCLNHAPVIKKCLDRFGVLEGMSEKQLANICNGPARNFFEAIGMDYVCIDTANEEGSLFFDLNFHSVENPHLGAYDLLTNFGTVEHAFNPYNSFKAAHDFVREGGYFIHYMPFLGYVDHGYYSFQPGFFYELAAANKYEILGMWLNLGVKEGACLIPWHHKVLKTLDLKATEPCLLFVIMRKKEDGEFKVPFQARYAPHYAGDFTVNYEAIVDTGSVANLSPQALIDGLSGRILQRELIKRYVRKFKRILFK